MRSLTVISTVATFLLPLHQQPQQQFADAYMTWQPAALPVNRHMSWLEQMTGEFCDSPQLSDEMIANAPEIMKGWATSRKRSAENAVAVERLVKRMVDESMAGNVKAAPTTQDYNWMLEGWSRSKAGVFAAERAEQILTQMQNQYEIDGDVNVQPNLTSFKLVIMAWRESGVNYAAIRSQRLLEWMTALYRDGKNDLALPDSDSFNIVLHTWSKSGHKDAAPKAERLLGSMEQLFQDTQSWKLQPSTLSFNAVLSAWANSQNGDDAWQRPLEILQFMEKLFRVEGNEEVQPDLITYHIVLGALARKGDANSLAPMAEKVMRSMERQCRNGDVEWRPDTIIFNTVIGLWGRSGISGAFRKSRSLLDRQLNFFNQGYDECKPDVVSFTSVLASCAAEGGTFEEKQKAFRLALSTFQQLSTRTEIFGEPNHVTYGTMMKACSRLLPNGCAEKKKWTSQIFKECASNGMVGGMVLNRLQEATTKEDFHAMLQGHSKHNLPRSWTCNVREKTEYRRNSHRRP